jgi:hypothetical protein
VNKVVFHLRETCPKDFYLAQVVRQQERSVFEIIQRLILNDEVLETASIREARAMINWAVETLVDKNVLTVENWLQVAYNLCKQRWDSSIDWLETQPMSKIHTMIQIVQQHVEDQEKEAKKAARKR